MDRTNMHSYFNSIKDLKYSSYAYLYGEVEFYTSKSEFKSKSNIVDKLMDILLIILVFSLIPVIPLFIYIVFNTQKYGDLDIWKITIPNFLIVQVGIAIVVIILLIFCEALSNKFAKKSKEDEKNVRYMSKNQELFFDIYTAYQKVQTFQYNNLNINLSQAKTSLQLFSRSLEGSIDSIKYIPGLELSDKNKKLFHLPRLINGKLITRIRGEKDINIILSILEDISYYVFSNLPEIRTFTEDEKIEMLKEDAFESFIKAYKILEELTEFEFKLEEDDSKINKENILKGLLNKKLIIKFLLYLLLILGLLSVISYIVTKFVDITDYDTFILTMITTSFVVAATFAAATERPQNVSKKEASSKSHYVV